MASQYKAMKVEKSILELEISEEVHSQATYDYYQENAISITEVPGWVPCVNQCHS